MHSSENGYFYVWQSQMALTKSGLDESVLCFGGLRHIQNDWKTVQRLEQFDRYYSVTKLWTNVKSFLWAILLWKIYRAPPHICSICIAYESWGSIRETNLTHFPVCLWPHVYGVDIRLFDFMLAHVPKTQHLFPDTKNAGGRNGDTSFCLWRF